MPASSGDAEQAVGCRGDTDLVLRMLGVGPPRELTQPRGKEPSEVGRQRPEEEENQGSEARKTKA